MASINPTQDYDAFLQLHTGLLKSGSIRKNNLE
jgi:hypothetical protein